MRPGHVPIPRYRTYAGAALFARSYRPFFLAAAVWAALALAVWLDMLQGVIELPTLFDPVSWHVHEMLYGFVGAAVAGYLLTSTPNWTGRMPLQGLPLAGLAALWVLGRAGVASSALIGGGVAAAADLSLWLVLLAALLREIVHGRSWRNLPPVAALAVLSAGNAAFHAGMLGWIDDAELGWRIGVGVIVLLIGLIGGRVVPSFTRNWLAKRKDVRFPVAHKRLDAAVHGLTLTALALWAAALYPAAAGVTLLLASLAHLVRFARWRGWAIVREPTVWVLHLGYFWVPVGLFLLGLSLLSPESVPRAAALHALTAGAMGTMILAVMTRVSLAQDQRGAAAGPATTAMFVLVAAAAATRVAAPFSPTLYLPLLAISGSAWTAAFGLFAAVHGRWMVRERGSPTRGA